MRYNEKELQALSRQPAEMAAELGMRGPKKGSVAKRRLVKLVVNFLFYFRPDEAEPLGALLLERCRVAQEEPGGFSVSKCSVPHFPPRTLLRAPDPFYSLRSLHLFWISRLLVAQDCPSCHSAHWVWFSS